MKPLDGYIYLKADMVHLYNDYPDILFGHIIKLFIISNHVGLFTTLSNGKITSK